MGKISKPELINASHQLDTFESGEDVLDAWLKHRALDNDHRGASKTFVVHENYQVIAYYSLATGSIITDKTPGKIRRNMPNPNPIPVMVLGRLAVHKDWQGVGLGRGLLKDAAFRTVRVARDAGIKAILLHALSDSAKHFYKRYGFIESPLDSMTLMLSLSDIEKYLGLVLDPLLNEA